MSKSRGTGISPLRYLDIGMNPEWLRYYIAAKLNANVEDLDFNPDDFIARVNSDLVGKYVNIASRAANFITKYFDGELKYRGRHRAPLGAEAPRRHGGDRSPRAYEARELGKAMREIMAIADRINQAFDARQPWVLAKDPSAARGAAGHLLTSAARLQAAHACCSRPCCRSWPSGVARELFGMDRSLRWERCRHAADPHRPVSNTS